MRAVVLAAGEGKRMRPLTANRPKPLLPAGPEPILARLLRQLAAAGVRDVTLVTHAHAEKVVAAVGDGSAWGVRVHHAAQGAARGTGHAVAAAKPPLDEPFLVVNGDVWLPEGALARVVERGPATVAGAHVADASAYGVFETKGDRVVRVVEKSASPSNAGQAALEGPRSTSRGASPSQDTGSATPPPGLANAGVYHAPAGFARLVERLAPSPRGELELTDALQASLGEETWRVVEVEDWLDVGRPWDLLTAAERALGEMRERRAGRVDAGATLVGKVTVAEGAHVKAGATIEGPVYIGRDAVVGPNCYVRPNSVILDGCKVGNAVEIKASILMEQTHVAHLSYVGDSILGQRVNFGAGTIVANLRHDGKSVRVTDAEGARVDSKRRKLGVVVGDDVHTGIHTSLNAGVMLAAGATTRPGEVVMTSRA